MRVLLNVREPEVGRSGYPVGERGGARHAGAQAAEDLVAVPGQQGQVELLLGAEVLVEELLGHAGACRYVLEPRARIAVLGEQLARDLLDREAPLGLRQPSPARPLHWLTEG